MYSDIEHAIDCGTPSDVLTAVAEVLAKAKRHDVARSLRLLADLVEAQHKNSRFLEDYLGSPEEVEDQLNDLARVGADTLEDAAQFAKTFDALGATFDQIESLLNRCAWHEISIGQITDALSEDELGKKRASTLVPPQVAAVQPPHPTPQETQP